MGIWLDDGISNRILSLLPLGLSFKSSPGQEHPPVPCHRRVIGPAWAGLAGVPSITCGINSHHGSQVRPGETSGKQTCPAGASVLRARTSLSSCYAYDGHAMRSIQQLLQRPCPPSRPLLLQPLLWTSNPICDGVMGNKTNKKKPQNKPHTLSLLLLVLSPLSKPYIL